MSKKILIVDDEEDIVTYLQTLFGENGYNVITAGNGVDAVRMAKAEKPDMITLDITMPEESGVKAFRELQESSETQNIPVIIVSGVDPEFKKFISSRKQVKPPAAYFEKPIDREELLNKVKEIIG
ncbi:response regulator [Bacteroidetes/Chlorobi group bacterium ChocPot_Mid]|jgi:DNA-binding response OmpR family regulator|nr:MAG: response regulator [Bacteroidetes/Chlorobi group bacterium ChocPot_Mid]